MSFKVGDKVLFDGKPAVIRAVKEVYDVECGEWIHGSVTHHSLKPVPAPQREIPFVDDDMGCDDWDSYSDKEVKQLVADTCAETEVTIAEARQAWKKSCPQFGSLGIHKFNNLHRCIYCGTKDGCPEDMMGVFCVLEYGHEGNHKLKNGVEFL